MDPKAPNVVAKRGAKKVRYRSTGRKEQLMIVACGSATGKVIPPKVIFESKVVNHAWTSNELPGMAVTLVGSPRNCLSPGWLNIFWSVNAHCFYCYMCIALTINQMSVS